MATIEDKIWDRSKGDYKPMPDKIRQFFLEYETLCKKHGLCLSHEDGHGGFEIENYNDHAIDWVFGANDVR